MSKKKEKTIRKTYSAKTWNIIKKLFVEEGHTAADISRMRDNYPTHQAISARAKRKNPKTGMSWHDERQERIEAHYNSIAPQKQVTLALSKITQLLSKKNLTTKDFDALSKVHKFLKDLTDWKYHVPMIYQVLSSYTEYVREHYPNLFTETDGTFEVSLLHFKNHLRQQLEDADYKGISPLQRDV